MSAVELLGKVDRFLRDRASVVGGPANQQTLQVVWQNTPANSLAEAVADLRSSLPAPAQMTESSQPDAMSLLNALNAARAGRAVTGSLGGTRHRVVWNLADQELLVVARWLDRFDPILAQHPGAAFAHKHLGCQWLPHLRGGRAEFAHPMLFGVVLSHPRHIQVPFQFYDADQYRATKRYLEEIDLATLIDRSVLPRGALSGGTTAGAG